MTTLLILLAPFIGALLVYVSSIRTFILLVELIQANQPHAPFTHRMWILPLLFALGIILITL